MGDDEEILTISKMKLSNSKPLMKVTGHKFAYDGPQLYDEVNDPTSPFYHKSQIMSFPVSQSCFAFDSNLPKPQNEQQQVSNPQPFYLRGASGRESQSLRPSPLVVSSPSSAAFSAPTRPARSEMKASQTMFTMDTTVTKPSTAFLAHQSDSEFFAEFSQVTPTPLSASHANGAGVDLLLSTVVDDNSLLTSHTTLTEQPSAVTPPCPSPPPAQRDAPPIQNSTNGTTSPKTRPREPSHTPPRATTSSPLCPIIPPLADYRNDLAAFCLLPAPLGQTVYCCITRNNRGLDRGLFPTYYLHLERCMTEALAAAGNSFATIDKEALQRAAKANPARRGAFLLAARKRKYSCTSNYLISVDPTDLHRETDSYIGKVRSNMLGTEFTVFDSGECGYRAMNASPGGETAEEQLFRRAVSTRRSQRYIPHQHHNNNNHNSQGGGGAMGLRSELASVIYEKNVFGFKGPRKFSVIIPTLSENGERVPSIPISETDGLIAYWKSGLPAPIMRLHNKSPVWNEETQSYVLNFHGRVTQASVKNFQLVRDNDVENIIMQFGRIANNVFTLDYTYPLCAVQAFGIVLSSFDGKLACE